MKRNWILFLAFVGLVGCGKTNSEQTESKTTYKLQTIEPTTISTTASYSASIRGKQDIEIYPQIGGYLTQVNVKEGEQVKKGDVLFIIEQAPYKAALESAKASIEMYKAAVATAELNYNNSVKLKEKGIVSESDLMAKQNALSSAKAQLALGESQLLSAQTNYDYTIIKSPSNGVVGKLPYRQGALVSAALPKSLTVVSDNSEMFVYFSMNENQVLNLIDTYGSLDSIVYNMPAAQLQLNNGTIYSEKGRVESISGVIEDNTGAISIRAVFPNDNKKLISGGAGNVLLVEEHVNTIAIPKTATFELQEKYFVYKVVDKKAHASEISISKQSTDESYIVTNGLSSGDVIIAEGAGLVREGATVNQ